MLLYQTDDGRTRLQVRTTGQTVWLTQKLMAELFQKDVRTINEHIHHIFDEGELPSAAVIRNFRTTAADGKNYDTQHYNAPEELNALICYNKLMNPLHDGRALYESRPLA